MKRIITDEIIHYIDQQESAPNVSDSDGNPEPVSLCQ